MPGCHSKMSKGPGDNTPLVPSWMEDKKPTPAAKAERVASDRWMVAITLPDGSVIKMHPSDAREFGNSIRGAAAECEVMKSRLDY